MSEVTADSLRSSGEASGSKQKVYGVTSFTRIRALSSSSLSGNKTLTGSTASLNSNSSSIRSNQSTVRESLKAKKLKPAPPVKNSSLRSSQVKIQQNELDEFNF